MAKYDKNSFTITLQDYASCKRKSPADFNIETIVVRELNWKYAVEKFNEKAKPYEAVLGIQEGVTDVLGDAQYMIRGTGVNQK
ncbi:hypothetical protein A2642_03470 [Candidatus Nomurabacteria bacterium RIFCSPHIGHO2_01_FULL_39_10]|uniref:Uncharacterized protein n=1 Tax=Candidatus Nomurabacteria bacterium RIFCSPHIGHO2_01_FULL_39_10 TaxID=1801733 RepID=A0A1F6V9B7_9BACT|nr:MAG: hypothetical protein A2642_03470 [Candidatus Nomurabacteria bacterium RIFCSPHIGHO2_01_FULL_39_10]